MLVQRANLSWIERLYLPQILRALGVIAKHMRRTVIMLMFGRKKAKRSILDMSATGAVTMQYPDEKWNYPEGYRGAPVLIKDENGREKCVSCQLCEFICPPRAIRIVAGEITQSSPNAHVERAPKEFDIDMLRCIYCGLCEEVCPEEAIFLKKDFPILVGYNRKSMIHHKDKLYAMGGVTPRPIKKWDHPGDFPLEKEAAASFAVASAD